MTRTERINKTVENLSGQSEMFEMIAKQVSDSNFISARDNLIYALSVITQELANIADNFEE